MFTHHQQLRLRSLLSADNADRRGRGLVHDRRDHSTDCDYSTIASQAKQKATAAGYVLSNYNRYVYVFPANSCTWWGLGSVGGNPSQAWIHTKWGLSLGVVGHEMGHNFGLWHSHSLDCGTASVAASGCTPPITATCSTSWATATRPHFNAYQKERLGWLNAGVSPPFTTVPVQAGTARPTSIAPLEDARDGVPRALKIPRGTSRSDNEWNTSTSEARQGRTRVLTVVRSQGDRWQRRQQLPPRHDAGHERVDRRRAAVGTGVHDAASGVTSRRRR